MVTIIILLVLAGITVAALTGDNGLIGKTGEAKNAVEEANIKEELEVNVLASYKKRSINYDLLNSKLSNISGLKYKNNSIGDTNKITKLPDWVDVKGYKFEILEDGTVQKRPDYEKLRSLYGTVVNGYTGYTATDITEWKLFYADEDNRELFIISSNVLEPPQPSSGGIPPQSKYSGSGDIINFEYGMKYNSLWLSKCIPERKTNNAKAIAYMCDPSNWSKYKSEKAYYAAGGATIEIYVASILNKQVNKLTTDEEISDINNVTSVGYSQVISTGINQELYKAQYSYWLASPGNHDDGDIRFVNTEGNIQRVNNYNKNIGLRPIVCIPVSTIEISGEGESVVLNYK